MTTTAAKQITIAIASIHIKFSLRNTQPIIEIQNGDVLKTMMMSEIGAKGTAKLNKAKAD